MKRFIILFSLFSLILLSCSPVKDGYVAVCGGNEVKIIDMDNSDGRDIREVWSWKTDDPESGLPGKYAGYLTPLDECKFVDGNTKLLLTSSKCAVVLLDIKSRKALFHAKVPMAHSAEMLPGGRVAVALSIHKKGNAWRSMMSDILRRYFTGIHCIQVMEFCGMRNVRVFMLWDIRNCANINLRIGKQRRLHLTGFPHGNCRYIPVMIFLLSIRTVFSYQVRMESYGSILKAAHSRRMNL